MSTLTITMPTGATIVNGKQVTFRAPCDCNDISGIIIDDVTYTLVDATTQPITGSTFNKDAMVSVIMDTENKKAFVQNGIINTNSIGTGGAEFIISTEDGANVTATDGTTTVGRVGSGILQIPGYGTWTVTAEFGGNSKSTTVVVDVLRQYNIRLGIYYDNFADNTWERIIYACNLNEVPDTWVVGATKQMDIGGVNYDICIIGKNHDTYTDGGTAPLTLQFKQCYNTTSKMYDSADNSGGWPDCIVRKTVLPTILAAMPSNVQDAIKKVNKITAIEDSSDIEVTSEGLFLISRTEVGDTSYPNVVEGAVYSYYLVGNTRVKTVNGKASYWWGRTPYSDTLFNCVDASGTRTGLNAHNTVGVSPAFCF